jgi:hypothetical protein
MVPVPDAHLADAAVSARFPAPAEEPRAWAGSEAPAGSASVESLQLWAKEVFGYGAPPLSGGVDLTMVATSADANAECEVDEASALGLHAACTALVAYTEEAKAAEATPEQ